MILTDRERYRTDLASSHRIPAAFLVLIIVAYVGLNVPLLDSKPDTYDQVKVFSVDELKICTVIDWLLKTRSFVDRGDPTSISSGCSPWPYGQLYPLLVAAPLMAVQPVVQADESLVVRWSIVVLVLAGILTLLMSYAIAARLYSPWYGILVAALLLATPEFLRWGNEIHPDLPQLAGLITGFYFVVRLYEVAPTDPRRRRIFAGLASACAGVAMAAKFNGFFLLPAIVLASNRGVMSGAGSRWRALLWRNISYGIGCAFVFVAVTLFFSPCLVANLDLAREPFERSASNSMLVVNAGLSLWERMLAILHSNRVVAESVIGYGGYVLFLAAIVHAGWRLAFQREEELRNPRIMVEVYTLPFLAYSLGLGYGLTDGRLLTGYERYLLPALPMMYISCLRIVALALQAPRRYRLGAIVALALVLLVGQAPLVERSVRQYREFYLRKEMGFFKVHDWVLKNIPKGSTIYTEAYIYVPFDLYHVIRHYAVSSPKRMAESDYVITKTLDYEIYKKPDRWHLYSKIAAVVRSRAIYEKLEHNELPGFERVALLSAGDAFEGNDAVAVYKNLRPQPSGVPRSSRQAGDEITGGGMYAGQIVPGAKGVGPSRPAE